MVDGKFEYLIRGFVCFVKNPRFLYLSVKMLVWVVVINFWWVGGGGIMWRWLVLIVEVVLSYFCGWGVGVGFICGCGRRGEQNVTEADPTDRRRRHRPDSTSDQMSQGWLSVGEARSDAGAVLLPELQIQTDFIPEPTDTFFFLITKRGRFT